MSPTREEVLEELRECRSWSATDRTIQRLDRAIAYLEALPGIFQKVYRGGFGDGIADDRGEDSHESERLLQQEGLLP